MRLAGRLKLGFYPLPTQEAARIRLHLQYPDEFAALDPCVGDGVAFTRVLEGAKAFAHGIEIDAFRAEEASRRGVRVMHANTLDVRCPVESLSLLYLNPPYDFEVGQQENKRLEEVFLDHTYRWLKAKGILVFVLPRKQLSVCARLLAEYFGGLRVYSLTEPESLKYDQIVVFGIRRGRSKHLDDSALIGATNELQRISLGLPVKPLTEAPDSLYPVPPSTNPVLTHVGIPFDEVEDLLVQSAAYRQAARLLVREHRSVTGRPLTPLHGGHVSILATGGLLNGVFGKDDNRHVAHWRSIKFVDHWEETEDNGTIIKHDRERFSHELTLVYANGGTQILGHGKKTKDDETQ